MKRILVVDDAPDVLLAVRTYMEEEGYEVTCATDGSEGEREFLADAPDLAILDMRMPGLRMKIGSQNTEDRHRIHQPPFFQKTNVRI